MDICINGNKADITLEKEKTVGDIMAGLDNWLTGPHCNSGLSETANFRLSGLVIDGKTIDVQSLEDSFGIDLASVETLDIIISSLPELTVQALLETQKLIKTWEDTDFSGRQSFAENWKTYPAAALLLEQYPELYAMTAQTLLGEGPGAGVLESVINERLRELENPAQELAGMEKLIGDIAGRLENLPLDIQTGKDRQASETVQIFTGITAKIFRIFGILKNSGFPVGQIKVQAQSNPITIGQNNKAAPAEIPIGNFLNEFNTVLSEMLAAYEQKDAVLVGDLAEYEMAPRLRSFYTALKFPAAA